MDDGRCDGGGGSQAAPGGMNVDGKAATAGAAAAGSAAADVRFTRADMSAPYRQILTALWRTRM